MKDYQEIRIQEIMENSTNGSNPKYCKIILEDDLVDSVTAGDRVTVK
jgi:DNA replicative helicase MCM subunit Mcm2 (Cdc46/Mcm family)